MTIPASARALLESDAITAALDKMERDAIEGCIGAAPMDDETRRTKAMEARAVRNLRRQLKTLARGDEAKSGANARV